MNAPCTRRIQSGDMLVEVGHTNLVGGSLDEAIQMLRESTDSVRLKIGRPDISSSVFTMDGENEVCVCVGGCVGVCGCMCGCVSVCLREGICVCALFLLSGIDSLRPCLRSNLSTPMRWFH